MPVKELIQKMTVGFQTMGYEDFKKTNLLVFRERGRWGVTWHIVSVAKFSVIRVYKSTQTNNYFNRNKIYVHKGQKTTLLKHVSTLFISKYSMLIVTNIFYLRSTKHS
jgi:hypothetical protein